MPDMGVGELSRAQVRAWTMGHMLLLPDICEPPKAQNNPPAASASSGSSMSSFRGMNPRRKPSNPRRALVAIGWAPLKDDEDDPITTPFEPGESTARKAIQKAKKKTTKKASAFCKSWTVPSSGPVDPDKPPLGEEVDEDYIFF